MAISLHIWPALGLLNTLGSKNKTLSFTARTMRSIEMTPFPTSTISWFPRVTFSPDNGALLPQTSHDIHSEDVKNQLLLLLKQNPIPHHILQQMSLDQFVCHQTTQNVTTVVKKMTSGSQPSPSRHLCLPFKTESNKTHRCEAFSTYLYMQILPGCVRQGEAALQGDAAAHEDLAEQQWRVTRGVPRRVTGGHPGGSTGRARLWLRLQLDGLSATEWEGTCLPRALPRGFAHAAAQGFKKTFSSYADVLCSPLTPDVQFTSSISKAAGILRGNQK